MTKTNLVCVAFLSLVLLAFPFSRPCFADDTNTEALPSTSLNYLWTCTAAPYNNYNYQWFYWQSYDLAFAQSQALYYCNNYYGGSVCVLTCR